jgi:hypothetical protein
MLSARNSTFISALREPRFSRMKLFAGVSLSVLVFMGTPVAASIFNQYGNSNNDGYTTLAYFPVIVRQAKPTSAPVVAPPPPVIPPAPVCPPPPTRPLPPSCPPPACPQPTVCPPPSACPSAPACLAPPPPDSAVGAVAAADAWCLANNGAGSSGLVDSAGNHQACLTFGRFIIITGAMPNARKSLGPNCPVGCPTVCY